MEDIHNDIININKIDENCYNYVMFSEKTEHSTCTYFDYKGQSRRILHLQGLSSRDV